MYSQIKALGLKTFALKELPALGASMLIAEAFFHFHSFTLECVAFLATWQAIGWIQDKLGLA